MKKNSLYIYIGIVVIAIIVVIVFANRSEKNSNAAKEQISGNKADKEILSKKNDVSAKANINKEIKIKVEELKQKFEESPEDTLKMRQYADFLSVTRKQDDAKVLYEKILKKDLKRTDIRLKLSTIYLQRQNIKQAEKMLMDVLKYDGKNGRAKFNLGVINANQGNKKRARQLLDEVINENAGTSLAKLAEDSIRSMNL